MLHRAGVLAVLTMVLVSPLVATADESSTTKLEELAVEMATTPAQHLALAEYYQERAQEADQEVSRHRRMKAAYTRGKSGMNSAMRSHCGNLISTYEKLGSEYRELAALHTGEAKRAAD